MSSSAPEATAFPYVQLLFVVTVASLVRLYKLGELPLGPYVDEIFTLNNSLSLFHRPFDLFGHTPLISEGWVETPNLYLYFNVLILQLFGVSYWSMKLLSVIPGIVACGAVFLIGQLLFDRHVALWTALLFTFAHWPVRLSRYGWDVSFMVMAFSLAIWLLLLTMRRGRVVYAYFAGITAALCLYSYVASRIALLSLLCFLVLEWALTRGRWFSKELIAFAIGTAMAAYPLLCYYAFKPHAFWVRTQELSVFNGEHPFLAIAHSIWRHALMFHAVGGTYARDNFPGLAMMDPLTGLLFIVGLAALIRRANTSTARLIGCAFVLNFIAGVFSISREGAPYVYRTAGVMVAAFLIVGLGCQWLESCVKKPSLPGRIPVLAWCAVLLISLVNLYLYFGLELKNAAAMRVMAYELRLIGLEIARDDLPVILAGHDLIDQTEIDSKPGEKYRHANRPLKILSSHPIRKLAIINFSGRYDLTQPVSYNFTYPRGIYFVEPTSAGTNGMPIHGPAKIIFKNRDQSLWEIVRRDYPGASFRDIRNIRGEPLLTVATLPKGRAAATSMIDNSYSLR
jgi:4-amino-4-deoxy-L-arabinose transferase-like glycosyltransferase